MKRHSSALPSAAPRSVSVLSAAALLLCGCQVYDPTLVMPEVDAGPPAQCGAPAIPPERPDSSTDGDDGEDYYFGLREVVLNQENDAWRDIGLDLDERCTNTPDFDTECQPPSGRRPPSDGNGGIDNVFGSDLYPLVDITITAMTGMSLQETARRRQDEGQLPVVRIRGWNGEPNDSRVEVTITNAIFVVPAAGDDSIPEFDVSNFLPVQPGTEERLPNPTWTGTDYGFLRDSTFLDEDPDAPLLVDDNAYIVNSRMVARLPDRFEILFPAEDVGVLVRLTDATAFATISEDRMSLENAVVGGRWRLLDLLATAENVGVCRGEQSYDILSQQLNSIADVRSTPGSGGEGIECDAISLGVAFSGSRMRFGGLVPGPGIRNVCTDPLDGGVDADAGPSVDAGADAGPDAG